MLDVAAFTVLAHGAMENFIEGLALWALDRVQHNWEMKQRASRSTAALLLHSTVPNINFATSTISVYDTLRQALNTAKSEKSIAINENNGVAPKHLRELLCPRGIDVPNNSMLLASLNTLVTLRHDWAHQNRFGAKYTKTAVDLQKIAADCVLIAEALCANAVALHL